MPGFQTLTELWYTFEAIKIGHLILILFWYSIDTLKSVLNTLWYTQKMIDDRKSYLNRMKCVWNGVKRYQILMYQKHVKSVFNLLSNFECLISVSKFSPVRARKCPLKRQCIMTESYPFLLITSSVASHISDRTVCNNILLQNFYATFPLCSEVIM